MSDPVVSDSKDFQDGVLAGRKASAEDLTAGSIDGIDPDKHSTDWYAGWLHGYRTYLEEYYDSANHGGSEDSRGDSSRQ